MKAFALQVKGRILAGERLPLNMNASEMRERLDADFGGWYDLLSSFYAETIAQFTQAEEINSLRYSYATESSDMMLHDVDVEYIGLCAKRALPHSTALYEGYTFSKSNI